MVTGCVRYFLLLYSMVFSRRACITNLPVDDKCSIVVFAFCSRLYVKKHSKKGVVAQKHSRRRIAWQGMAIGESPNDPAFGGTRNLALDPPRKNPSHPHIYCSPLIGRIRISITARAYLFSPARPSSLSLSLPLFVLLHTPSRPSTSSFSRKAPRVRASQAAGAEANKLTQTTRGEPEEWCGRRRKSEGSRAQAQERASE